jgi:hypothetical protein
MDADRSAEPDDVDGIDRDEMAGVVGRALDDASAEVEDWRIEPIAYRNLSDGARSIYRATGTARSVTGPRPWSAILKTLRRLDDAAVDPTGYDYWKREPELYRTAVLEESGAGFRAARSLGQRQVGESLWRLWLEDLDDITGESWPIDRYRIVARHLGAFNGRFLVGDPLPTAPWLADSSKVLSYWGPDRPAMAPALALLARDDAGRSPFPSLAALVARWDELVAVLGRRPRVFCHNDAMRENLVVWGSGDDAETIAIDWQFAGLNAVGSEIGMLVAGSIAFFRAPPGDATTMEGAAIAGYLDGLADVGWRGDPADVVFGYRASAVLRLGLIAAAWLGEARMDPAFVENFWSRPADEVVATYETLASYLDELAAEALAGADQR